GNSGGGTRKTVLESTNTTGTQTWSGAISGDGSIRRNGTGGTTILSGGNSYTGGTTVDAGTLTASSASALGNGNVTVSGGLLSILNSSTIADASTLSVTNPGMVDLGSGVNETIASLILGGTTQANGTYGSTLSSAQFKLDQYFSGTGILSVGLTPGDY